jgi:hypothetical protein
MFDQYFNQLLGLWFRPSDFYEKTVNKSDNKQASRFVVLTSFLVALELGLAEALTGGDLRIVAFVTLLLILFIPFVFWVWVHGWTWFIHICGLLLGEDFPMEKIRPIVAFSAGGWITLGLGFGWGGLLSVVIVVFQALGFQKVLGYSKWNSAVYAGFPFSIMAVLVLIFTLLFKVFK